MDEGFKSINEIVSDHKDDQIRQDDIAWSCLEGELYGDQKAFEYDAIQNETKEVLENTDYEDFKNYHDPYTISCD
jgi:hypothetical protein